MKGLNNAVWRGIFAVLVGLALVLWPEVAVIYMIMVIGAGFLLPGIFSVVSYFLRNKETFFFFIYILVACKHKNLRQGRQNPARSAEVDKCNTDIIGVFTVPNFIGKTFEYISLKQRHFLQPPLVVKLFCLVQYDF